MTITQAIATALHDAKVTGDRNVVFRRSCWHSQDALHLFGSEYEIVPPDDPAVSLTLVAEDVMANDWEVKPIKPGSKPSKEIGRARSS